MTAFNDTSEEITRRTLLAQKCCFGLKNTLGQKSACANIWVPGGEYLVQIAKIDSDKANIILSYTITMRLHCNPHQIGSAQMSKPDCKS